MIPCVAPSAPGVVSSLSMSRDLVIGIDVGTTACKVIAVRQDGFIEGVASCDYPLHTPHPGHVEQDAREVLMGVREAMAKLLANVQRDRVAGICFSGAMHGIMPVDGAGQPLSRAITWADLRAVNQLDDVRDSDQGRAIYAQTGCPLRWIYLPAKLRWMRECQPEVFQNAVRFVAIKDWIIHQLTGRWATDICIASGSGLLHLHTHGWHEAALELAGIDASRLPPLAQPQQIIGELHADGGAMLGLPAGVHVMPGGGDGGLANIGAGGARPGSVVLTVGTSGAVRITCDEPLLDPFQRIWCYTLTDQLWYAGGAINNGGLAVETIRRLFYSDAPKAEGFDALFDDAAKTAPGADGLLILPYFNGERNPHWRPDLRAGITGLTGSHDRSHVARAILEAVAFCLADVWQVLRSCSGAQPPLVRLTGGITRSRLWSQIVCDVLNLPVMLNEAGDASALGAAAIGHWGLGHVSELADFPIAARQCVMLEPDAKAHAIYAEIHGRFQREAGLQPER